MDTLTFYVVKSKDGKYLRSTGMSGGKHWVDDINQAKVWNKIGPAKAQVTFWSINYPEFGVPTIIPLLATAQEPLSMEEHVKESVRKAKLKELNIYKWHVENNLAKAEVTFKNSAGWRKLQAKEQIDAAKTEIERIKNEIEKNKK